MTAKLFFLPLISILSVTCYLYSRSIHRPHDPQMPHLITQWVGGNEEYHFWHNSLEESAIFQQFDLEYFEEHMLPDTGVQPRDRNATPLCGLELKKLLEEVTSEVLHTTKKQLSFKNFTILKQKNYDPSLQAGQLVLRFKNYPFVVKLFIENPQSFIQPFSKGLEPSCFFIMGGGASRFLAGFSRVINVEIIQDILEQHPEWQNIIDAPCKWFWHPKDVRWFEVRGENIGTHPQYAAFPSVYAVICQAIDSDTIFTLKDKTHRTLGIKFSHMFGNRIDPHIDNFMVEKGTGKVVVIDTEHFPTIVGLREPLKFESYSEWYTQLACKCVKDCFLRTKKDRHDLQKNEHPIMTCISYIST